LDLVTALWEHALAALVDRNQWKAQLSILRAKSEVNTQSATRSPPFASVSQAKLPSKLVRKNSRDKNL